MKFFHTTSAKAKEVKQTSNYTTLALSLARVL